MRKSNNDIKRIERILLKAGCLPSTVKAGGENTVKVYFGTIKDAERARTKLIERHVSCIQYMHGVTVHLDAWEEKQQWKGKAVA